MTVLNSTKLNRVRTQPHVSDLYLSIYKPTLIFEALVNNPSITKDARVIAYDNVTVGSYTDIFAGAQMLVYTAINPFMDVPIHAIGYVRVKSATPTEITIAENSHINWGDNYKIQIYNYVDVEAIYPRIITDPADDENVIFYKDFNIAYTNQNDVLGTFVCMGPHRAGFKGEQVYWTSSGTFNVAADSLTYSWIFEGANITGSTASTPGYVTYDTPGFYKTILTVSSDAGGEDTSYRFVSIYDRPGEGDNPPIQKWEITDLSGSRSSGGYSAKIKIRGSISDIADNALVVIFSEDWYGGVKESYGGNALNASNIFFVGYVTRGSVSYNYRDNYVEFTVGSVTESMKNAEGFSISCESKTSPTTWFEVKNMTIGKSLYHYLRWHSTVLMVTDFEFRGGERWWKNQYFDTDRSSLFDAINNFLSSSILGELVADRQGKLWTEVSAAATDNARTAFSIALNANSNDWIETPFIEDRQLKETSFIEMGGIAYNPGGGGGTGTSTALLSNAPGRTPSYRGRAEVIEGLVLVSQAQLNNLAGNVFAYKNSKYPSLDIQLRGNYNHLDIAPIERVTIDLAADENPRGIIFTNEPFHINSVSWNYNAQKRIKTISLNLSQLTDGVAGDRIPVPEIPEGGGFSQPPVNVPPISVPTIGGGGAISADYAYALWNGDDQPAISETRNITLSEYSAVGGAAVVYAKFTVSSAGWYIVGIFGEANQNGGAGLSPNVAIQDITSPGTKFVPWGAGYTPQSDVPYSANSSAIVGTSVTSLGKLGAGSVVQCTLSKDGTVPLTVGFYAWIMKISNV